MRANVKRILIIVALILLVPLYGNFFIEGWDWGIMDFVFAAIMLLGAGFAFDFILRKITSTLFRVIAFAAVILVFLLIWTEVAVDAVSKTLEILF